MKKKTTTQYHTRRYYIHRVLKNHFRIDSEQREVDIYPYTSAADIPIPWRWYVGQLVKLGYNIQLKLFHYEQTETPLQHLHKRPTVHRRKGSKIRNPRRVVAKKISSHRRLQGNKQRDNHQLALFGSGSPLQ